MTATSVRPTSEVPAADRSAETSEIRTESHRRLADVQGLRAIAVLAVVLNHLTGWPSGGFVGVDVFFVISGFVITNSLTAGARSETTFRSYVRSFYAKRARRLLPAALVTTIVSCGAAYLVLNRTEADRVVVDGIWATLFSANWHLISVGTDYFAAAGPASPFEHYWSLSVEEQFYVVWPLLVFAVWVRGVARPAGDAARSIRLLSVVAAIVAASFVWAWIESSTSPVSAYFSTFTRAWELGTGAALALTIPLLRRRFLPPTLVSFAGCGVIVCSALFIDGNTPFPAPGALAPVVGSSMVILAATSRAAGVNPVLRWRGSVAVGDASYAVYLVHLPVIVFIAGLLPHATAFRVTASALIVVGASLLVHLVVERPFLRTRSGPTTARLRGIRPDALAAGIGLVLVGASVVTLWPGDGEALAQKNHAIQQALERPAATTAAVGPHAAALSQTLRAALARSSWPTLDPSIPAEEAREPVPAGLLGCGQMTLRAAPECSFGDKNATHTAYLLGDSTAMAYAQAFRSVFTETPGWRIRVAASFGCSFDSVQLVNGDGADASACTAHNDDVIAEMNRVRPDLVFVTNTYRPREEVESGAVVTDSAWTNALADEIGRLPAETHVVLVEPAPLGPAPSECFDASSLPAACVYRAPVAHVSRGSAERVLANLRGWTFLDTRSWFCDPGSGYCPMFAGSVVIKHDAVHVSSAYDDVLAPVLGEAITEAGVRR